MPPPLICPAPPNHQPGHAQDCPLYHQRALTEAERLRRAVLAERRKARSMASLVWTDLNRTPSRMAIQPDADQPRPIAPTTPPTRPALSPSEAEPLSIFGAVRKGAMP